MSIIRFFYFSTGNVSVVAGAGVLEVPPGAVVAVGTQPGGLPELPVDRAGLPGRQIGVSGASALTLTTLIGFGTILVSIVLVAAASPAASSVSAAGLLHCRDFGFIGG